MCRRPHSTADERGPAPRRGRPPAAAVLSRSPGRADRHRYGLEDGRTLLLNGLLLFLVLFYVYPMRFLVELLAVVVLGRIDWGRLTLVQWRNLMVVYGGGYAAVYGVLGLMFRHAYRHREELELDDYEVHRTLDLVRVHGIFLLPICHPLYNRWSERRAVQIRERMDRAATGPGIADAAV